MTGDNDIYNNSFKITYQAKVLDDPTNAAPVTVQAKSNTASLNYTGNPGSAVNDSHSINFGEPKLSITKAVSPSSNLQAGDTVTITLTVTNTGTAPAFDIEVTDTLNEGSDNDLLNLTTVAEGTTPAGYGYAYSNPTVTYTQNDGVYLAGGNTSVTFTFTAQVRSDVVTGSTFTNSASVTGDSQNGAVDDDRDSSDSGSVNISSSKAAVAKSIVATSEAWTTNPNVAVGEVVTYRLTYTIPEGLTRSGSPAILTDTLPAGQQYLTGSATIRAVRETGLSGSVYGALPTITTLIVPTISGQELQFALGDLTNSDDDGNSEQIFIELKALVLNISDNNRGDSKTNTGYLRYLNRSGTAQSRSANVATTIVEPDLAVTKTADPTTADGGDTITFTVVVANQSVVNVSRAWEVTLEDALPARYQNPALTSATLSRGSTNINTCAGFTGNTLNLNMNCLASTGDRYLAPGESITVIYTATLDPDVAFEETVDNTAQAQATSLPGIKGTGDAAPGVPTAIQASEPDRETTIPVAKPSTTWPLKTQLRSRPTVPVSPRLLPTIHCRLATSPPSPSTFPCRLARPTISRSPTTCRSVFGIPARRSQLPCRDPTFQRANLLRRYPGPEPTPWSSTSAR